MHRFCLLQMLFTVYVQSFPLAPYLPKRQLNLFGGLMPNNVPTTANPQQQQALARLGALPVAENVYRIQPADPAAAYSSALIIFIPKEQGSTAADLARLIPAVAGGNSKPQPQANAAAPAKPTPAQSAIQPLAIIPASAVPSVTPTTTPIVTSAPTLAGQPVNQNAAQTTAPIVPVIQPPVSQSTPMTVAAQPGTVIPSPAAIPATDPTIGQISPVVSPSTSTPQNTSSVPTGMGNVRLASLSPEVSHMDIKGEDAKALEVMSKVETTSFGLARGTGPIAQGLAQATSG